MFDVTAIGEILIDFLPIKISENDALCFECNPGGAPANVLSCITKFGGNTNFIGKVGRDIFGGYLKDVLIKQKINITGLSVSDSVKTTLAFVKLDEAGDRTFSFYRDPGADTQLTMEDIDFDSILNSNIFHFGSLSLTNEPSASTTLETLNFVKKNNKIISFDPNYRQHLWGSENKAIEKIKLGLSYTNILKISDEELELVTGKSDLEKGINILKDEFDIKLIIVTLGERGCQYSYKNIFDKIDSIKVNVVDTTGAGDIFFGSVLYYLCKKLDLKLDDLTKEDLHNMLLFANIAAAISTEKKGAIPSIPEIEDVCKKIQ